MKYLIFKHLHIHVMPSIALTQGYENNSSLEWKNDEQMAAESLRYRKISKDIYKDSWFDPSNLRKIPQSVIIIFT